MISVALTQAFTATVEGFQTGLVGTLGVRIRTSADVDVVARSTVGITEGVDPDFPTAVMYSAALVSPGTSGVYEILWDDGAGNVASEDLIVSTVPAGATLAGANLCSLADVRLSLELPAAETTRDTLIEALIPVASQQICQFVEREFAPVTVGAVRQFKIDGRTTRAGIVDLAPYDLQSATLVSLHPETTSPITLTAGQDYVLAPVTTDEGVYTSLRLSSFLSVVSSTMTQFGYALVDVTGTWGFPSVPTVVAEACSDAVSAWMRRDVPMLGLQLHDGANLAPDFSASFDLPIAAIRKINPYRRNAGAY